MEVATWKTHLNSPKAPETLSLETSFPFLLRKKPTTSNLSGATNNGFSPHQSGHTFIHPACRQSSRWPLCTDQIGSSWDTSLPGQSRSCSHSHCERSPTGSCGSSVASGFQPPLDGGASAAIHDSSSGCRRRAILVIVLTVDPVVVIMKTLFWGSLWNPYSSDGYCLKPLHNLKV